MSIDDNFWLNNQDALILTANKRLARYLELQYNLYHQEKKVWLKANIMAFNDWLYQLFEQLLIQGHSDCLFINDIEEQLLWQQIVQDCLGDYPLINISQIAKKMCHSYHMLQQWNIKSSDPRLITTTSGQLLVKCLLKLTNNQTTKLINQYQLLALICQYLQQGLLIIPSKITLCGFIEWPPLMLQFIAIAKEMAIKFTINPDYINRKTHPIRVEKLAANNTEDEIYTMLSWARDLLKKQPTATIACIIPQAKTFIKYRAMIVRYCHAMFAMTDYNISLSPPLANQPIIDSGLKLINLTMKYHLTTTEVNELLHCPFLLGAKEEYNQRALIMNQLSRDNSYIISIDQLIHYSQSCPMLKNILQSIKAKKLINDKQPPSFWAKSFSQSLQVITWPYGRSSTSDEFQALQKWQLLLDNMSQLDSIITPISQRTALVIIKQIATHTPFQIQTHDAPIQILGSLEAIGIPFDYSWVMGLDNHQWPEASHPDCFIPYLLQKELNMPHTNESQLKFAHLMTEQLINNNQHVILSYAKEHEQHERQPSQLVCDFPTSDYQPLAIKPIWQAESIAENHLTIVNHDVAPPMSNDEKKRITGGSQIIKEQALCPFRGFSYFRLQTRSQTISLPTRGLNNLQRGGIIHRILEKIWGTLQTQEKLLGYDSASLQEIIKKMIDEVVNEYRQNSNKLIAKTLLTIEKKRLLIIINNWLNLEKERPPFIVEKIEQQQTISFDELSLTIKIDRIDRLLNNDKKQQNYIIIDYKSKLNGSIDYYWLGERPYDLQLPLYACSQSPSPKGLYLAEINSQSVKFKGIATDEATQLFNNKICDHWQQQLKIWQTTINQLVKDFDQGQAIVAPKSSTICRQCNLHSLCRIFSFNSYQ